MKEGVILDKAEKIALLRRFMEAGQIFNRKAGEVASLRESLGRVTYSYEPRIIGGSIYRSREFDTVGRIVDLEKEIRDTLSLMLDLREEIEFLIERVEDARLRLLLYYRYIDCLPWEEIAENLEVASRSVFRLHARALDALNI